MYSELDEIVNYCANLIANEETKNGISLNHEQQKFIKDKLGTVIQRWLADKNIEAFIRYESIDLVSKAHAEKFYWMRYNIGLNIGSVAIYNNLGSIEKKSSWLNKVVLSQENKEYHVRTHRARTDKNFLSPLDTEFLEFFREIMMYINQRLVL